MFANPFGPLPSKVPSSFCNVGSFTDTDLYAVYKINTNFSVHGSILNVFDKPPPLDMTTYGGGGETTYDPAFPPDRSVRAVLHGWIHLHLLIIRRFAYQRRLSCPPLFFGAPLRAPLSLDNWGAVRARITARMITPRTLSQPVTALPWRLLIAMWLAAAPVALATGTNERAPPATPGCLPTGNGYLRARIRGALNLDLDWHNAELECEGEPRPDGSGLRISFAGPKHADGRRTRLVFGVASVQEGRAAHELPTNLTVIFEGEERLFATRGEDRCTVDTLSQERIGALGGATRAYRVVARGFCVTPASSLDNRARILVSQFDFAGAVVFTDEPR